MLQLTLLLLGCALSKYLWTIARTVAGVVIAVTTFGVTSYVFLTLTAALCYNCPYQTPPSILTRTVIRYVARGAIIPTCSLSPLPSVKTLGWILGHLRSGIWSVCETFGCVPAVTEEVEQIPLAVVVATHARIFEDFFIDWEVCRADARCISWILDSTTDTDVIFSTVRFAADTVWYPEIAGALSPHILADLFFNCLLDGRVIPGEEEHASSVGMALASVLSIHLSMEPENQTLRELCGRIRNHVEGGPSSEPTFLLVTVILKFIAGTPTNMEEYDVTRYIPSHLPTTHKLWLSRVVLQTIWRWRCVREQTRVLHFYGIGLICELRITIRPPPSSKRTVSSRWLSPWDSRLTSVIYMPQTTSTLSPIPPTQFAHRVAVMRRRQQSTISGNNYKYVLGTGRLINAI